MHIHPPTPTTITPHPNPDAAAEKETRGALRAAVDHALDGHTVVVLDSLNYIKGLRYQLYCTARTEPTQHCVVRGVLGWWMYGWVYDWAGVKGGGSCPRPSANQQASCRITMHLFFFSSLTSLSSSLDHLQVWVEAGDRAVARAWNAGREDAYPESL